MNGPLRCPCDGDYLQCVHRYESRPEGETAFPLGDAGYLRQLERCGLCGHYVSRHELPTEAFYEGAYVDATYGARLRDTFDRIVALPPDRSDNTGRVERVLAFARDRPGGHRSPTALDVGSGLCVFLHRLAAAGWRCTALDPDERAVRHARETVGVEAVQGDYLQVEGLGRFDLVSFNKVLEHVPDPVAMLARSAEHVLDDGFVYVEVPDGEAAARDGYGREEFFIEHEHVFSAASLALLVERAGFSPVRIDRLREPSTKYTLAAFLVPA